MKVTVLSDNIGSPDGSLKGEWGLAFHIAFRGRNYLLDAGGSALFLDNARILGIPIGEVDCAILSHAHYDHSNGMEAFFRANPTAAFFVSPAAGENCYSGVGHMSHYIGLPKGILSRHADRIVTPPGVTEVGEGVFIVPHSTPGLGRTGRREHLFVRRGWRRIPDDFAHEQSLVCRSDGGLVVFNSCSHSGAPVVVGEVRRAFPGESVKAYVGGLHLFRKTDAQVLSIAESLRSEGIPRIITGHCTGERAYAILRECLGEGVEQFHCGSVLEL